MVRGIRKDGEHTASALELLNSRLIVRPVPGRYAATLYATFDPATRALTFSNAGLPHPVLVSASGCRRLGKGGFPSGLFPDATYDLRTVQLEPGDAVLFATDGLHELRDAENHDFSCEKLAETWQQCRRKRGQECLDVLFEEATRFTQNGWQNDDITTVVLTVR
jgi:sigma-B regulation protein RsbU (phosphoserine phosphatase)